MVGMELAGKRVGGSQERKGLKLGLGLGLALGTGCERCEKKTEEGIWELAANNRYLMLTAQAGNPLNKTP